jgi:hypothetical protein
MVHVSMATARNNFVIVAVVCTLTTQFLAGLLSPNASFLLSELAFLTIFIQWIVFSYASGKIFGNTPTEKYFDL